VSCRKAWIGRHAPGVGQQFTQLVDVDGAQVQADQVVVAVVRGGVELRRLGRDQRRTFVAGGT
jgi:hypothetical protein